MSAAGSESSCFSSYLRFFFLQVTSGDKHAYGYVPGSQGTVMLAETLFLKNTVILCTNLQQSTNFVRFLADNREKQAFFTENSYSTCILY